MNDTVEAGPQKAASDSLIASSPLPSRVHGWGLGILRFWGGATLGNLILLDGIGAITPLFHERDYSTMAMAWQFIFCLVFGVYFTWFYREKDFWPLAHTFLTGLVYLGGGAAITSTVIFLTIPLIEPYLLGAGMKFDAGLLEYFYLFCGLSIAFLVMKGKRRF